MTDFTKLKLAVVGAIILQRAYVWPRKEWRGVYDQLVANLLGLSR